MPCLSDYMQPSDKERLLQRTAQLLLYVRRQTGVEPENWVLKDSEDRYLETDRSVIELCRTLRNMAPEILHLLINKHHDRDSLDLFEWWRAHQIADDRRKEIGYMRSPEYGARDHQ